MGSPEEVRQLNSDLCRFLPTNCSFLLFSSGVFHWNFTVFCFGSRNTPDLPDSCDNYIPFLKGILPLISTSVEFSCSKKDIQPLFERSGLLMDSVLCLFFLCHHFLLEIFSCSLAKCFSKPASLLSVLHGWNQSNFEFNKNGVWCLGTLLQEKCQQTGKSPVQQQWGEKESEHLAHKEKPGELDLFSLLRRRTGEEGGLIAAFCHLWRDYREELHFSWRCKEKWTWKWWAQHATRKIWPGHNRDNSSPREWCNFEIESREVVDAPSWEIFKIWLYETLSSLIQFWD